MTPPAMRDPTAGTDLTPPPPRHGAPAPTGWARVRLIVILGGLSAFGPLSIDMYLPALPALSHDLAAPSWAIQLTLTTCLAGLALGQLVAGPISDARGRRAPLFVGLAVYVVTSLLCAVAPSAALLVVLRGLQGVGGAAGIVIARAVVRDLYAGVEAARFFSLLLLVNGLAPILAPILGAQLIRFTSWRGIFVVLALLTVVLIVAAAVWLDETVPRDRRRPGGVRLTLATFAFLLRDRAFTGYALSSGLVFAAMFAYISASPFVLEGIYGVSPQVFSAIFATNALGIMLAAQTGGRLVRRVGSRPLLIAGLAMSATGGVGLVAAVTLDVGLPGVLPALFLVASSVGLCFPNATALALENHPRTAGAAAAVLGTSQYVLGGAIAPLVGVAGAATALPMAITIGTASIAASIAFRVLAPRARAALPGRA